VSPSKAIQLLASTQKARIVWAKNPQRFFVRHANKFDNPRFIVDQMQTYDLVRFEVYGLCADLSSVEKWTIGKGRPALVVLKPSLPVKEKALFLAHELGHAMSFAAFPVKEEVLGHGFYDEGEFLADLLAFDFFKRHDLPELADMAFDKFAPWTQHAEKWYKKANIRPLLHGFKTPRLAHLKPGKKRIPRIR